MKAKLAVVLSEVAKPGPTLVLARFRDTARFLESSLSAMQSNIVRADGSMKRSEIGFATSQFRSFDTTNKGALVITRELGGRGLDFPSAARVVIASPRSNYQAVAQELARIRSRQQKPKVAVITYFANTEEQAKALRLADHLAAEKFGPSALFDVRDTPSDTYRLEPFERRTLMYEESLAAR